MTTSRLIEQSIRSMRRYRLRTVFMMLGSIVGVAALTFAVSLGQGVQGKVLRTVKQVVGDASVLVIGGGGRMFGSPRAGAARLTIDDISAVAKEVPGITEWDPQAELSGTAVRRGDASATVRLLGHSERWMSVWGRGVSRGESFDASAVTSAARVALIGETVERALFAGEDPIGAEIRIGAVSFRVIGVLDRFGVDMHGMDRDDEIVVPVSTLMRRLTNTDVIGTAKLLMKDPARAPETAREIQELLRRRHAIDRDQPDDFKIMTALQAQQIVALVRRVLLMYVPLVSAVVLIVGGIVAATLMLGSVNERIAEIGLRRAVGAMAEDIQRQFMVETAVTIIVGGIIGIAIAYVGVAVAASRMQLGDIFSWTAVLVGIAASAVTGWLAGVVPARRASAIGAAEALR